jgi:hypothetical protein
MAVLSAVFVFKIVEEPWL